MDILSRLQALPPGRFHYKLLVLVGIGWLFDAMDTGVVSFILPALGKEWGSIPPRLHHTLFSAVSCNTHKALSLNGFKAFLLPQICWRMLEFLSFMG